MTSPTVSRPARSKLRQFQVSAERGIFSGSVSSSSLTPLACGGGRGGILTGTQSPLQKENVKTTENESLQTQIAYC